MQPRASIETNASWAVSITDLRSSPPRLAVVPSGDASLRAPAREREFLLERVFGAICNQGVTIEGTSFPARSLDVGVRPQSHPPAAIARSASIPGVKKYPPPRVMTNGSGFGRKIGGRP